MVLGGGCFNPFATLSFASIKKAGYSSSNTFLITLWNIMVLYFHFEGVGRNLFKNNESSELIFTIEERERVAKGSSILERISLLRMKIISFSSFSPAG